MTFAEGRRGSCRRGVEEEGGGRAVVEGWRERGAEGGGRGAVGVGVLVGGAWDGVEDVVNPERAKARDGSPSARGGLTNEA